MQDELQRIFEEYMTLCSKAVATRLEIWSTGLRRQNSEEVIAGLLARQASLSFDLLLNPNAWTNTIAPLVLRAMIEVHLTVAWIFLDLEGNATKYREYGLGQHKLLIEKYRSILTNKGENPDQDSWLKSMSRFLDWQRSADFITVDVGNWSGISVREMFKQTKLRETLEFEYNGHSAAVHSMWHFTSIHNLRICDNPLHRYHFLPVLTFSPMAIHLMVEAASYFEETLKLFDEKTGTLCMGPSPYEYLMDAFDQLEETAEGKTRERSDVESETESQLKPS